MREVVAALVPLLLRALIPILLFGFFFPIAFMDLHPATKWLILATAAAIPCAILGLWERHNNRMRRPQFSPQHQETRSTTLDVYVEKVKAKRQQQQRPA